MSSRAEQRRSMDHPHRFMLIENDMDEVEVGLAKVGTTLNKILWTLVGLLISVSTGALLLALNLVVGG